MLELVRVAGPQFWHVGCSSVDRRVDPAAKRRDETTTIETVTRCAGDERTIKLCNEVLHDACLPGCDLPRESCGYMAQPRPISADLSGSPVCDDCWEETDAEAQS